MPDMMPEIDPGVTDQEYPLTRFNRFKSMRSSRGDGARRRGGDRRGFFCLIPSSSIPLLFLILLGKKHSCVVHKYFELKRQTGYWP